MPQNFRLDIQHIAFERNYRFLFNRIQCCLQQGDLAIIRGVNGSGKSTLLRILAGLIEPSMGEIHWQQRSILKDLSHYQQQLHYIGHHAGIKQHLTVYENLQLSCVLKNHTLTLQHLENIIQQLELQDVTHTQTQFLSAGQLRRVGLARLLMQPAPLWILDEPMTALDAAGQKFVIHLLKQHLTQGGIVIAAMHDDLPIEWPTKTIWLEDNKKCIA